MKKFVKQPKKHYWVWLLTAFFSGVIGVVFAVFLAFPALYGLWKTRENVQIPAVIKKWDLNIVSKSGGKSASSLKLNAEYEYQYNGVNFTGTRTSLFKYEQETYYDYWEKAELLCYIDPNDAGYSVVDKRFSIPWFLFVFGLPIILFSLCCASLRAFFNREIPQVKRPN